MNRPRSGGMTASLAEQVPQGAALRAGRVRALERLVELLRIAQQHERARRGGDRHRVGQRELAGLVDEEDVARCRRTSAWAHNHDVPPTTSTPSSSRARRTSLASFSVSAVAQVTVPASAGFWPTRTPRAACRSCPGAAATTSSSSLPMTLWLLAVTPTLLAGGDEVEDHARPAPGLAGTRRALDGQRRAVEVDAHADVPRRWPLPPAAAAALPARCPAMRGGAAHAAGHAPPRYGPVPIHAVLQHGAADVQQSCLLGCPSARRTSAPGSADAHFLVLREAQDDLVGHVVDRLDA